MSVYFEPRALWSVGRVDTSNPSDFPVNRLRLDRRDFMNGGRWPITLRYLLAAPVGYLLAQFDPGAAPTGAADYRNDGQSAMADARIRISAPQSTHYTKSPLELSSLATEPRWEPAPGRDAGVGGADTKAATLFGAHRWQFDHPINLPRTGAIEYELGSLRVPTLAADITDPAAFAEVGFDEVGGVTPGNLRSSGVVGLPLADTAGGYPWSGAGFPGVVKGPALRLWDSQRAMTPRAWKRKRVTAEGGSGVEGVTVHVDQVDWDTSVVDGVVNTYAAATAIPSPLGYNLPTRARTVDGGTKAWWWKPGAPLALVCPTMTPAFVYTLPQPITLAPGDKLDVELFVPGAPAFAQVIQVGVSLCGEAAVES